MTSLIQCQPSKQPTQIHFLSVHYEQRSMLVHQGMSCNSSEVGSLMWSTYSNICICVFQYIIINV